MKLYLYDENYILTRIITLIDATKKLDAPQFFTYVS